MKRFLVALVGLSTAINAFASGSPHGCAADGKMVQSFALFRDQHKPIADVDTFIERMPDADMEQQGFYKKLARATYAQPELTPEQAESSFVRFCSTPSL
jgi:hypothetical protein